MHQAPVRPKIAAYSQLQNCHEEVEDVNAVGGEVKKSESELVWWQPKEKDEDDEEEDEEDDEVKHPMKWWANEDKGLSRDGLREDPQEGGVQERRAAKRNTKVHTPTRDEVEDHERTHCPFAPWCRHCVMGRGRNAQHKKNNNEKTECEEESKVPRVSMDSFS
jgi:hypothetical protein